MTIAGEYYASRDDKLSHKIVCSLRVRESGQRCFAIYDIVKLYENDIIETDNGEDEDVW